MRGINKVILVGNLGKAPEVKTLSDGTTVTRISIATTETYRNKDGQQVSTTQWHTVILWRQLAKLAGQYLQKGSYVYVEGKLNHRQYTNTEGTRQWVTEVFAAQLLMLDKKYPAGAEEATDPDILPF